MAETYEEMQQREIKQRQDAPKRTVQLKNESKGQRFLFNSTGKQVLLGPGQEAEVEVTEAEAKRMEEASKAGYDLRVQGHDPEAKVQRLEEAPEVPKEHADRRALADVERDLMEEGQEADRERREKAAKMTGAQLAAETGIHMHARGTAPEVVAAPADASPKPKK